MREERHKLEIQEMEARGGQSAGCSPPASQRGARWPLRLSLSLTYHAFTFCLVDTGAGARISAAQRDLAARLQALDETKVEIENAEEVCLAVGNALGQPGS